VEHLGSTSQVKQKIKRMLVNFKTDVHDDIWFLWCASVRLSAEGDSDTLPAAVMPPTPSRGSGGADPTLSPVCLNPAMSSPTRAPSATGKQSSRVTESVCPFTDKPLSASQPYFVTYKAILDFSAILDRRTREQRPVDEVPPLLARVCPDLDGEQFARERANPLSLFMYTRVLCSEAAYLDFSSVALPGVKVLPALSKKTRRSLLTPSASAPTLPRIDSASAHGMLSRGSTSMQRLPPLDADDS